MALTGGIAFEPGRAAFTTAALGTHSPGPAARQGTVNLTGTLTNTGTTLTLDTASNGYGTWNLTSRGLDHRRDRQRRPENERPACRHGRRVARQGGVTLAASSDIVALAQQLGCWTLNPGPSGSGLTVNVVGSRESLDTRHSCFAVLQFLRPSTAPATSTSVVAPLALARFPCSLVICSPPGRP